MRRSKGGRVRSGLVRLFTHSLSSTMSCLDPRRYYRVATSVLRMPLRDCEEESECDVRPALDESTPAPPLRHFGGGIEVAFIFETKNAYARFCLLFTSHLTTKACFGLFSSPATTSPAVSSEKTMLDHFPKFLSKTLKESQAPLRRAPQALEM